MAIAPLYIVDYIDEPQPVCAGADRAVIAQLCAQLKELITEWRRQEILAQIGQVLRDPSLAAPLATMHDSVSYEAELAVLPSVVSHLKCRTEHARPWTVKFTADIDIVGKWEDV